MVRKRSFARERERTQTFGKPMFGGIEAYPAIHEAIRALIREQYGNSEFTNREIARRLPISEKTALRHLKDMHERENELEIVRVGSDRLIYYRHMPTRRV